MATAKQASGPALGTLAAWGLQDISMIGAIMVSIVTVVYTIVLILKNLDEWRYQRKFRKDMSNAGTE